MRRLTLVAVVLGLMALATVGIATADSGKTVHTRGDEVLEPNRFVRSDLRFSPGTATIKSGDTVTWVNADDAQAPHTVTIATENQLVQTFSHFVLGTCPDCDAAIGAALGGHFPGGPPVPELDDGDGEFDDPGDSVLFFPGQSFAKQINSPAGTTLSYFCAIHPWMQGSISVK
ncbi:MAG: cupredoxin domain-containing protein [Actinomycetota bacterium]